MSAIQNVCVYCGSGPGTNPKFMEAARDFGRLLAESTVGLVYGGGSIGLMGVIADTVLAEGGEVVGVIPDFLIRWEVGHCKLTELIVTDSMHDRKRQMFEMADAFVVLPGGMGTLDETFELITWRQLRLHDSPIIVLDVEGYWAPLLKLIEATIAAGFADPATLDLFSVVRSPEDVLQSLACVAPAKEEALTSHL